MPMEDTLVRSWKEYAPTGTYTAGPVRSVDLDDLTRAEMVVSSWQWSFSCCDTTLCAGCTI